MLTKMNESSRKTAVRVLLVGLIMALLVTMVPQPVFASNLAQTACSSKHTVTAGETLSSIAADYGITWQELAEANNLKDPYTIYVGQVLCIPAGAESTPESGDDASTSEPDSSAANFDVTFVDETSIRIKVYNYPKSQSHIVRISNFNQRWAFADFDILGRFRTDSNGNADVSYRLPKENRDSELIVCLKNAFTDQTQCGYFSPFE